MILVDTNAWVAHIRRADRRLVGLLEQNRVFTCDVVLGELALGAGIPPALRRDLALLPAIGCPTVAQTKAFVERHRTLFAASGVGWADAEIIVTASEAGALLYSGDEAVRTVWRKLGYRLA